MLSPLRVAVLCSQRAPGLAHLVASRRTARVPFDLVCCVTSADECTDAPLAVEQDVAFVTHALRAFRAVHAPERRLSDSRLRIAYDRQTVRILSDYRPDLVILSGYLLRLTHPMLTRYPRRIVNVHHSDLLLREASGGPRFPGLRAVRDAILSGERETRCCAHLVTEELDAGPVRARSQAFPVPGVVQWARETGQRDVLKSATWVHQEWMLREAFGPLMVEAIETLAIGAPTGLLECA